MTERYLLETYGRGGDLPTQVAAETLADIWHRAVFTTTPEPIAPGAPTTEAASRRPG